MDIKERIIDVSRPDWDAYFLNIAKVVATRSTCIRRHYGAVIVKDNKIISTGYNGSAKNEKNCCDTMECVRSKLKIPHGERYELCVAVHAEMNAIINGDPEKMKGSTIYIHGTDMITGKVVKSNPCMMCDRAIKNAGIKKIVYVEEDNSITELPLSF